MTERHVSLMDPAKPCEIQEGGSSLSVAEVAGSLMLNRFLTSFSFPKPNSDLGSAEVGTEYT